MEKTELYFNRIDFFLLNAANPLIVITKYDLSPYSVI